MVSPLIAVVDDDLATLEMFDTVLTDAGYRTFLWPQAKDAHLMIQRTRPDLVILDMWMEERDSGRTVLGLLELDSTTKWIPVIICSAHVPGLRVRLHEFRQHGHVTKERLILEKPFDPNDLLAKIAALLSTVRTS